MKNNQNLSLLIFLLASSFLMNSCKKDPSGAPNSFTVDIATSSGVSKQLTMDEFTIGFYKTDSLSLDSVIIEGENSNTGDDIKFTIYMNTIDAIGIPQGHYFNVVAGLFGTEGAYPAVLLPSVIPTWLHGEGGFNGKVNISAYDDTQAYAEGFFSGYLVDTGSSDTLYLSNGRFYIDN